MRPKLNTLLIFLTYISYIDIATSLITLGTIRNLTVLTDECRVRIVGSDGGDRVSMSGIVDIGDRRGFGRDGYGGRGGNEQGVLRGEEGDDERGEVEDAVIASIRILCSDLLVELEKPVSDLSQEPQSRKECETTIKEFHSFLASTVKFLFEIQKRQERWRWSSDEGVFDAVSWLQGLWASRKTNSQDRSFIEQQLAVYTATGCFGKNKEVLRRDVEVVEYLNDLLDSFV